MYIGTNNIPFGAILLQNLAIIFFIFYKCNMNKASHGKTQSLSTSTSTYFNTSQRLLHKSISPNVCLIPLMLNSIFFDEIHYLANIAG